MPSLIPALLLFVILAAGALATTSRTLPDPTDALYFLNLHRMTGEYLGAAVIALYVWIAATRRQHRIFAAVMAAACTANGLVGVTADLALVHSLLAQFLCAAAVVMIVAGAERDASTAKVRDYGWPSLRSLSVVLPALIATQIALGAAFRQGVFGLMPHVIGAMLVTILVLTFGSFVLQQCKSHTILSAGGRTFMVVTFVQVFLGLAVFTARSLPTQETAAILVTATAHAVTGAALLAASLTLAVQVRRYVIPKAN